MSADKAGILQKRVKKKQEPFHFVLKNRILWWFSPADASALQGPSAYEKRAKGYMLLHGQVSVGKTPARTAADLTLHSLTVEDPSKKKSLELCAETATELASWIAALAASATGTPNESALDEKALAANPALAGGFGKLFKAAVSKAKGGSDDSSRFATSSPSPGRMSGATSPAGGASAGVYGAAPPMPDPTSQYGAAPSLGSAPPGGQYGAAPSMMGAGHQYGAAPSVAAGAGNQYARVHVGEDAPAGGAPPPGGVYGGIGAAGSLPPLGGMYGKAPPMNSYGAVPQQQGGGANLPPLPGYQHLPGGGQGNAMDYMDGNSDLSVFDWFHGKVSRSDTEVLLWGQPDGVFLVRNSSERGDWVISWMDMETLRHIKIEAQQGRAKRYMSGTSAYDSIAEAVTDLRTNGALTNPLPSSGATVCDLELKRMREQQNIQLRTDIPPQ